MPTVTEVKVLHDVLVDVTLGEALSHEALTVVPLFGSPRPEPDWLTLPDAGDRVTVAEVSETGSVPVLGVKNDADQHVLLLDGEELVGAKQNRILNTTVLVAAHTTLTIPVSCVEAGRWGYRSRRFSPGDSSLYASLRAKKAARVTESLTRGAGHISDQNEIWADVAERSRQHNVESPTAAMHDVYMRYEPDLSAARAALTPRPGQVGALVFVSGEWVGLDLLPSPSLFARVWSRLCVGYMADAIGTPTAGTRIDPSHILARVAATPVEHAAAVGLGEEVRLVNGLTGAALIADGIVAHLMAFPAIMS